MMANGIGVALIAGMTCWTLFEYVLHRFGAHTPGYRVELFSRPHRLHHRDGRVFAPMKAKLLSASLIGLFAFYQTVIVLSWRPALAFSLGFVAGFLYYEVLHRRLHTHAPIGAYGRWARRHHFYHHFHNPKVNHGVTSPLWDWVFSTYSLPGVVEVPRPHAMDWLIDPETDEVERDYSRDYRTKQPI